MHTVTDIFGSLVFDDRVMRAVLPSKVYASLRKIIDEGMELDVSVANAGIIHLGATSCYVTDMRI